MSALFKRIAIHEKINVTMKSGKELQMYFSEQLVMTTGGYRESDIWMEVHGDTTYTNYDVGKNQTS